MDALVGRGEELERLVELARDHDVLTLVGLPGIGKRALARAFCEATGWTAFDGSAEPPARSIVTSTRPRSVPGEVVYRVGPLDEDAALELLARRLTALDAGRALDEPIGRALVRRVDRVPAAIALIARVAATRSAAGALEAIERGSIFALTPDHEPWVEALDALLDALREDTAAALAALTLFRSPFDGPAAAAVLGASAPSAISELADRSLLFARGPGAWSAPRVVRDRVAARAPAPEAARDRHARWVLDAGADPRRRDRVAEALGALFLRADAPAVARRAGARLAPLVADRGPVDAHLRRLVSLDVALGAGDVEVQLAIAQLHLVLGEPEPAWRRLEPLLESAGALRGRALHLAANALRRLGRDGDAAARYDEAIEALELSGQRRELGVVLSNLGGLLVEAGDVDGARRAWSRALRCFAVEADPRAEAVTLGDLGLLDHELGDLDAAERRYARALAMHEAMGDQRYVGSVSCDLGELHLCRGNPLRAREHLERARAHVEPIGDLYQLVLVDAALAMAATLVGDVDAGRARFDRARDLAPEELAPVMALYEAGLTLADARAARAAGDGRAEREALAAIERALARSTGTPDEARRVSQMLRAELGRHRRASGWIIAPDARFFVTPEEVRVDLSRRHVPRRLLEALLAARLERPGEPLGLEELLRSGWPGQRVLRASARNRLHVALSGLRKLGLDPLLVREGGGYLLDPAVEIVVARGEA